MLRSPVSAMQTILTRQQSTGVSDTATSVTLHVESYPMNHETITMNPNKIRYIQVQPEFHSSEVNWATAKLTELRSDFTPSSIAAPPRKANGNQLYILTRPPGSFPGSYWIASFQDYVKPTY